MTEKQLEGTEEINALGIVYKALHGLNPTAQLRVIRYSAEMLGLALAGSEQAHANNAHTDDSSIEEPSAMSAASPQGEPALDDVEGINAVALKWMRRSSLASNELQKLFSLGIEEIDLVAQSVPGENKKERMRNVLLLKGIAAYLSSGAPRVTYEQLKEACLHYDAYDGGNFAAYLKAFAAEVGGTKEAGFTLTPRGLTSATALIKQMLRKPE